jgi:hypothetical protein
MQPAELSPKPWYGQAWLVVLALVFLFPIGVYLMWFHSGWGTRLKWAVTVVVVIYVVVAALWWAPHQLKCERELQAGTISEECRR